MRIKPDFTLRQVAGTWVILPVGSIQDNFNGVLMPTDSGVLLWKQLENGCDIQTLIDAVTTEYDVGYEQAQTDVEAFVEKLRQIGCLEDE